MTVGTLIDAALDYAQRGLAVFPLHTPTAKGCSCRKPECDNVGKHPRTRNGFMDATTDAEMIKTWWKGWPEANIGIATGKSHLVVVDVDPRHGGEEAMADVVKVHGKTILDTVTALTGGGGYHLIYKAPPGSTIGNITNSPRFTGVLGRGIDVRAVGGYIVAPPSVHASGTVYDWETNWAITDREPSPLPHSLFEVLQAKPERSEDAISMADILAGVPEGERDWQLFRAASKLRYADVPLDFARQLIAQAAAACVPPFPVTEAIKKVDSAYQRYEPGAHVALVPAAGDDLPFSDRRQLLDAVIREGVPPAAWLIPDVLVRGAIHLVYGEPESGKTILTLAWMLQVVRDGGSVVFVDEETGIANISRLLADMKAEGLDERVHYFPFASLDKSLLPEFLAYCDQVKPTLIVFDSLTDMLAAGGIDENDGTAVTRWMLDLPQRLARCDYQPAVALIDHITKDAGNTKYSVASRAKKAKSDVLWYVDKANDFDQTKTGMVHLHRHKNRPGVLPKRVTYVVGGQKGRLIAEGFDPEKHSSASFLGATEKRLLELLEGAGLRGLSRQDLARVTGNNPTYVSDCLKKLAQKGRVVATGSTRNSAWRFVGSDESLVGSDESFGGSDSSDRGPTPPKGGGEYPTNRPKATKAPHWQEATDDWSSD